MTTESSTTNKAAWGVVVAATLGMTVSFFDRQTLTAIAPSVTKSLGLDNTQYGWLLSGFSIAYLVGAPAAGAVVDRLGSRWGFAIAVAIWSVVAGAHALASTFATLFVLRVLLGAAEAPSFPAAAQAIHRSLPDARRPLAFGLLFTGSSLGAIIAAKLAVKLDATYGFRFAFVGTALVGTLWLPLWLFVTRGGRLRRTDDDASSPTPQSSTDATLVPSWFAVVSSPPVVRALIAILGCAPAVLFAVGWTSKYLVDEWKVPKDQIANYLMVAPILFDVGSVGFGAIASSRTGYIASGRTHKDLILVSMLLTATIALAPFARTPLTAILLCGVAACGAGGLYALVNADMLARVPSERTSSAGGMAAAAQSLAHIISSPIVGWTIDRTHSYKIALIGVGLIAVPTSIAFVAWPGMRPLVEGERAS